MGREELKLGIHPLPTTQRKHTFRSLITHMGVIMKQMGIQELRVNLSRLIKDQEPVEIMVRGKVVMRLEPVGSESNLKVEGESGVVNLKVGLPDGLPTPGDILSKLRRDIAQIEGGELPVEVETPLEERREVPAHLCEEGQVLTVSLRELQAREGPTKGLATWSQCRVIAKREVTPLGVVVSVPDFSEVRSCPKPEKKKRA